ncbi:hypothetical protein DCCM_4618 [Desulfocucumis palustris]|uniref:Uncharacterized protein n=1 Tax=Desulfocucumis palustris TaxID=1898651 RepID=A0A2L2XGJ5_9FIRM|nr:DUF2577 family protein [Desulfocucumis palustris]GBF35489.1 hypothetical protein DCCM_4618 [Desulfocucumis palustris]
MDPFKQIVSLLEARITDKAGRPASGMQCELGTITSAGLKLDNFKHEIKDFLIADWLVKIHLPDFFLVGTATSPVDGQGNPLPGAGTSALTKYSFNAREFEDVRLELKQGLKTGDRVLVAPVNGGQDFVILARVMPNA